MKTTLKFMKIKTVLLVTAIVFSISSFAQAPNKMSYQAVIRDATNNLVVNQSVGVKVSILKTSASGTAVFVETYSATTNANGLVSIEIGSGTNVSGSISGINWGNDAYYIKTETDPTGGTSYSISATNQLLSVPFALSSKSATNMELKDLTNVTGTPTSGQVLKWDGTTWKPQNDLTTGGGTGSYTAGAGITISGTNVIAADLGADISTAELQNNSVTTAKIASNAVTSNELSNNSVTTTKITANAITTNEIATNAVTNPKIANNAVNTANIANDAVTAPKIDDMGATNGQVLQYNGTNWAPTTPAGGSSSPWTLASGNVTRSTGNVGIGTATPTRTLEVTGSSSAKDMVFVENTSNSAGASAIKGEGTLGPTGGAIGLQGSNDYSGILDLDISGNEIGVLGYSTGTSPTDNYGVYGHSNGIGVGAFSTSTTQAALEVENTSTGPAIVTNKGDIEVNAGIISLKKGAEIMRWDGNNPFLRIYDSGVYKSYIEQSDSDLDIALVSSNTTGKINLKTGGSDRLTILNNGNVGIGVSAPTRDLEVAGDIDATGLIYLGSSENFRDGGSFRIAVDGSFESRFDNVDDLGSATKRWDDVYATNGTVQTSDRRDKTNIQNLDYGLKEIMELRAVRFQWKDKTEDKFKLGFIAQELQPILNEVVKEDDVVRNEDGTTSRVKNERLGVYYSDIIPVAVKAIQEQQKIIEDQQKQIDELKALILSK